MTRIFDALRKAGSLGPPAAAPVPHAPPPAPARTRAPLPPVALAPSQAPSAYPPMAPPVLAELRSLPPLTDDVLREMSALRVHLEAALPERVPRTIMLVGAQGGEGTTTLAAQLAATLARDAALRVLLVDAHGRRPVLSDALSPGPAQRGSGPKSRLASPETGSGASERLRVLCLPEEFRTAEGIPVQALRGLLEAVDVPFDWVIVDGPPVLESPDAATLATVADGVLMVVQAGRTKRPVLARSVEMLRKTGARVLGTVLNRRRLEIPGFIYRRI